MVLKFCSVDIVASSLTIIPLFIIVDLKFLKIFVKAVLQTKLFCLYDVRVQNEHYSLFSDLFNTRVPLGSV